MYAYGYRNVAFFNTRAEGDEAWFSTQKARDVALNLLREIAVDRGLSESAAQHGIYPIKRAINSDEDEAWLRDIQEQDRPGIIWGEPRD